MPIYPISYGHDIPQFSPVSNFLNGMKFMQERESAKAELEGAKLRNRLYDMSLREAESEKAFKDEIANSLLTPQNVKNVTVAMPQQMTKIPLHGAGGIPIGWDSNNPAPAPGVDEQTVNLPQMTSEQFDSPEVQGMLKGMKYDVTDEQITPFLDEAKQYGVTEQMLRSNPQAAMAYIEKKKADATALMDKKINMIKDLNAVNPTMAANIWNSDPALAKMGKMEITGDGEIKEHKVGDKVLGYSFMQNGKWNFVRNDEMTDFQRAMIEQRELDRQQRSYDAAEGRRAAAVKVSLNQLSDNDISSLAESMSSGQLPPSQVSQRGATRGAVQAKVREVYPSFDFGKSEANYAYMKNAANLRAVGLASAVRPRVEGLYSKVDKLQNFTQTPIADRPINKIRREVGSVAIADFESLRNAIIQEVNTALSGSSTASDYRIRLELENLGSDRTPAQLKASINNLIEALDARTDASQAVPYPWEVVQGKMTLQQWKDNQKNKSSAKTPNKASGGDPLGIRKK